MINGITVTDIKMSFWSMVVFMVKWTLASIPAVVILIVLLMAVMAVFGVFGTMLSLLAK